MKIGFYPRLALQSIRKNRRLYYPYILTCIGMVAMYYILSFLTHSDSLDRFPGSDVVRSMLSFGTWVVAIFAGLFLFYSNSFLIRRRKREFGLYNILGMGKWNIGRILVWESCITAAISLLIGIALGVAMSKLAELCLANILQTETDYVLRVSGGAILMTCTVFGTVFLLLLINGLWQVRSASAISLLHSEQVGEKPPKGNWFLGLLGAVLLGGAYYIAVTVADPISALVWFFVAVVMVILATYLLFIAGSVLLCRILQKNKRYYYKASHFVSVSSMVYRMKRNGAGLASICILATMVLVTVASTASLYLGVEDILATRYPSEINMTFHMSSAKAMNDQNTDAIRSAIHSVCKQHAVEDIQPNDYRIATLAGLLTENVLEPDVRNVDGFVPTTLSTVYQVRFLPLADYNRTQNANETLNEGEILIALSDRSYPYDTLSIGSSAAFRVKKHLDAMPVHGNLDMNVVPTMCVVVPDLENSLEGLMHLADFNGDQMISFQWNYDFDTGLSNEQQAALSQDLEKLRGTELCDPQYGITSYYYGDRADNRIGFYSDYGSLFFLGILLSIVFLFAAVLIIYYKQISEGYEDQSRFEIMQKVGMTKGEIRKSINSQLLTVFFLPLIGAACHLAFAFPMMQKILLCFNLTNTTVFTVACGISFLAFALLYVLVYRITSKVYYHIVSGANAKE